MEARHLVIWLWESVMVVLVQKAWGVRGENSKDSIGIPRGTLLMTGQRRLEGGATKESIVMATRTVTWRGVRGGIMRETIVMTTRWKGTGDGIMKETIITMTAALTLMWLGGITRKSIIVTAGTLTRKQMGGGTMRGSIVMATQVLTMTPAYRDLEEMSAKVDLHTKKLLRRNLVLMAW